MQVGCYPPINSDGSWNGCWGRRIVSSGPTWTAYQDYFRQTNNRKVEYPQNINDLQTCSAPGIPKTSSHCRFQIIWTGVKGRGSGQQDKSKAKISQWVSEFYFPGLWHPLAQVAGFVLSRMTIRFTFSPHPSYPGWKENKLSCRRDLKD